MKSEVINTTSGTYIKYPYPFIYTGGVDSYIKIGKPIPGVTYAVSVNVGDDIIQVSRTSVNGQDIIFPLQDIAGAAWSILHDNETKEDIVNLSFQSRIFTLDISVMVSEEVGKLIQLILINGSPARDVSVNTMLQDRRRGVYWNNMNETFEVFAPQVNLSIANIGTSWSDLLITQEAYIGNPIISLPTSDIEAPTDSNGELYIYIVGWTKPYWTVPLYFDMCTESARDMELMWFDDMGLYCCWRFTEEYSEEAVTADATLTNMAISFDSMYQKRMRMTHRQTTYTLHSRKVPRDVVPYIKSILSAPLVWRYNSSRMFNETMIVENYNEKDKGRDYVDIVIKVTDTPISYE